MSQKLRVLVVEDSLDDTLLLVRHLTSEGDYEVDFTRVETAEAMRNALQSESWDVVLSDYKMPLFSGPQALNILKECKLDIPFIIVSGSIGEEVAVEVMKAGSHDYVMKDNLARLVPAIQRELREAQMRASHREAEERLRFSERLRSVGEMAASIIHDLKTPMQAVLTTTEALDTETLTPEQRTQYCHTIDEQVQRMVALTQQVLEFAKGQIRINASMIDLVRFCEELVTTFKSTLTGSGIKVNYSFLLDSGVSPSVILDKEKVWRVLINLLHNATDAMPYGGEICVRLVMNREIIRIEVADTGHGIPEMIRDKIFKPFVSEGKANGTGLGLAIVDQVVKAHGGRVTFETAEGRGTTFVVTLPRVSLKAMNHIAVDVVHALQG